MCGIIGCYGKESDIKWVEYRVPGLSHRGPDSQFTVKCSDFCSFGAARLAMTDVSNDGNQPFFLDQDWLVFNGEIYNYKEIKDLFLYDHLFKSVSDTEVLGKILQNPKLLRQVRFNGPYAYAFFDCSANSLRLSRDDSGKKPLYYKISEGTVFFSSIQEQLALNPLEYNSLALIQVLSLGYVIDPTSIFPKVKSLIPGTIESFSFQKSELFHTTEVIDSKALKPKKVYKQDSLRQEILKSVERRVDNHDQIAISLSGGIDSTVISICLKLLKKSAIAYSVVWPDSDKARYNLDSKLAKEIAHQNDQIFVSTPMSSAEEIPLVLDEYLELFGEPNCNPSGLSMMSLYARAHSDGNRMMLTGDGADELFFGYDRYKNIWNIQRLKWLEPIFKMPFAKEKEKAKTFLGSRIRNLNDWSHWHQTFSQDEIESLFNFSPNQILQSKSPLENIWSECSGTQNKNKVLLMMELDRRIWLTMESNKRLDRVSMAYSIEARCPFQDKELVKLTSMLNADRGVYGRLGKSDLLEAFPELKEFKLQNQKVGFISPLGHWIRVNKKYIEQNLMFLAEIGFCRSPYHESNEYIEGLASGRFSTLRKIWTLFVLARWMQRTPND